MAILAQYIQESSKHQTEVVKTDSLYLKYKPKTQTKVHKMMLKRSMGKIMHNLGFC